MEQIVPDCILQLKIMLLYLTCLVGFILDIHAILEVEDFLLKTDMHF